jgi:SAM-dependent methyltransferase
MFRAIVKLNSRTNRWFAGWFARPDARTIYRERLDRHLAGARRAVHLGAGARHPSKVTSADLSRLELLAVDVSVSSLLRNAYPARVAAWGHRIPLRSETVDVIFSEYLMEHVADPAATLREAHRVLRPGGTLLWLAPNLWSYQGVLTRLTPFRVHRWVNRALEPVTSRTAARDVFPTYFRINSIPRIRRSLAEAGFRLDEIYTASGLPHYTQVLPVVHQLAILGHCLLDRWEILEHFRMAQVVRATKPGKPHGGSAAAAVQPSAGA